MVRKGERHEGKLQILNTSRELALYTLQVCKSDKVFPKSQRWVLSHKIVNTVLDIFTDIREAYDASRMPASKYCNKNTELRTQKLIEAHMKLSALLGLVDLAYGVFNVETHRIEHWSRLIKSVNDNLNALLQDIN